MKYKFMIFLIILNIIWLPKGLFLEGKLLLDWFGWAIILCFVDGCYIRYMVHKGNQKKSQKGEWQDHNEKTRCTRCAGIIK